MRPETALIKLGFPHKYLWPNGRSRIRAANHREEQKHKDWAYFATKEAAPRGLELGAPVPVQILVYPKGTGPAPDKDNCIAAAKHYLDGIALALGINDRSFDAPTVAFGPREGRFEILIGGQ